MYARLDRFSGQRGHGVDDPDLADLGSSAAGQPGLLGRVTFRQLAGPAAVCLTLWDSEASATTFPGPRPELAAVPGEAYEVSDTEEGPAAGQAPACARLLYFDGPRAPEQAAAADLAGKQRIWPAIRGLSGLVGVYVLVGRDLGSVVVTLATSVDTLDATERAVMATGLAPGEDPALLPGPDRIEIHRVTDYHLPAGPAASIKGR
jgi:hypothetical protein